MRAARQEVIGPQPTGTFTILATDGVDWGLAVASCVLAVGAIVPAVSAGVGIVATQATVNVGWKAQAMQLLEGGASASEVVRRLIREDARPLQRQIAVVDAGGNAFAHTGTECAQWAGHHCGAGFAAAGNFLASESVLKALANTFCEAKGELANRLLLALKVADRAGGDRRGRQSASLLVMRRGAGIEGMDDSYVDLRVDSAAEPVSALVALLPQALAEAEERSTRGKVLAREVQSG